MNSLNRSVRIKVAVLIVLILAVPLIFVISGFFFTRIFRNDCSVAEEIPGSSHFRPLFTGFHGSFIYERRLMVFEAMLTVATVTKNEFNEWIAKIHDKPEYILYTPSTFRTAAKRLSSTSDNFIPKASEGWSGKALPGKHFLVSYFYDEHSDKLYVIAHKAF